MNNGKTNKNKSKINKKEEITSTNRSRRGTKAAEMTKPVLNLVNTESLKLVKYSKMCVEVQSRNTPNWFI